MRTTETRREKELKLDRVFVARRTFGVAEVKMGGGGG